MNKVESGTIFKFKIPFNLGFGYCKLIDFSSLSIYFGITIKVYDYFGDSEVKSAEFFKGTPLFMNPLPIVKLPSLTGRYMWKKIGVLQEECDKDIPIYKKYVHEGFGWEAIEEYKKRQWYARVGLQDDIGPLNFDTVSHLEELFLRSTITIEKRVAMQILRYKGVNVKEFFSANSTDDSWKVDYNTQQFIPLYKTIPSAIKGKPLIKGFVPDQYLNYRFPLSEEGSANS